MMSVTTVGRYKWIIVDYEIGIIVAYHLPLANGLVIMSSNESIP